MARGALIEQSSFSDTLPLQRATNGSRIAPEYNAGFVGAHAFTFSCPRLVQRLPDGGHWRAGRTSQQHDVGHLVIDQVLLWLRYRAAGGRHAGKGQLERVPAG